MNKRCLLKVDCLSVSFCVSLSHFFNIQFEGLAWNVPSIVLPRDICRLLSPARRPLWSAHNGTGTIPSLALALFLVYSLPPSF